MTKLSPANTDLDTSLLNSSFFTRDPLKTGSSAERRTALIQDTVKRLLHSEGVPTSGTESKSILIMRPHQSNAITKIADNLAAGNTAGYIKHACSTGKTIVAGEFLNRSKLRAVVAVYSYDAVTHFTNEFATHFPNLKVGPYGSSADVQLVTHAKLLSLWKHGTLSPTDKDAIVIDESHLMLGPKRRNMVEGLKKDFIIIGLTATDTYYSNKRLSHLLGEPWHTVSIAEAIREKMIAPFKVELVKTHADISKVEIKQGDFNPRQLSKAFDLDATIKGGVKIYQERFLGKSLLVHCATLASAALWAEEFTKVGIPAKVLSGALTKDQRREIIKEVERGDVPVLCGNKLVAASLNIRRLEVLFNATPTLSLLEAEQRFNRITRLYPDNPEKTATILEFMPRQESRYHRAILVPDLFGGNVNFGMSAVSKQTTEHKKTPPSLPLKTDALEVTTDSAEIFKFLEERTRTAGFTVDISKLRITEKELREFAKSSFELHEQAKTLIFSLKEALTKLVSIGRVDQYDQDANLMEELLKNTSAIETIGTGPQITYSASKVGNILHPRFTRAMNALHDRFNQFCDKQSVASPNEEEIHISANEESDIDELVLLFCHLGSLNESLKQRLTRHFRPLYEEVVEKLINSKHISVSTATSRTQNCLNQAIYDLPIKSPHTVSRFIAKQLDRLVNDWSNEREEVKVRSAELSVAYYQRRQFEEQREKHDFLDTIFFEQETFIDKPSPDKAFDKLRRSFIEDVIHDGNFEANQFRKKVLKDFPTTGQLYLDSIYEDINQKLKEPIKKSYSPRWLAYFEDKLSLDEINAITYLDSLKGKDLLRNPEPPWSVKTERRMREKIPQLSVKSRRFLDGVFDASGFSLQNFLKHSTGAEMKDLALLELALSMTHKE